MILVFWNWTHDGLLLKRTSRVKGTTGHVGDLICTSTRRVGGHERRVLRHRRRYLLPSTKHTPAGASPDIDAEGGEKKPRSFLSSADLKHAVT
jgi:hypothetical protein